MIGTADEKDADVLDDRVVGSAVEAGNDVCEVIDSTVDEGSTDV